MRVDVKNQQLTRQVYERLSSVLSANGKGTPYEGAEWRSGWDLRHPFGRRFEFLRVKKKTGVEESLAISPRGFTEFIISRRSGRDIIKITRIEPTNTPETDVILSSGGVSTDHSGGTSVAQEIISQVYPLLRTAREKIERNMKGYKPTVEYHDRGGSTTAYQPLSFGEKIRNRFSSGR